MQSDPLTSRARPRWGGRLAVSLTRATLGYWGDVCHLCGRAGSTTADHLISRVGGGAHVLANLRPAHHRCNSARGATPLPPHRLAALVEAATPEAYVALVARPQPAPMTDGLSFID